VRVAAVSSTISNDFLHSPTLNPLAAAQTKHTFSILASAPEKPTESNEFETILEAFWFKFRDFGSLEPLIGSVSLSGLWELPNLSPKPHQGRGQSLSKRQGI